RVIDVDLNLRIVPVDADVVLGDRKIVIVGLAEDRVHDLLIVVRAGGPRLVFRDLADFRGLHLHRDHLVRDEDTDQQKNETNQTAELTFTQLAAIAAHTRTSVAGDFTR